MGFQESAGSLRARLHVGEVKPAVVVGAAVLLLVALGAAGLHLASAPEEASFAVEREPVAQEAAPTEPARLAVYVSGRVEAPALYYLDEGARVADAIAAAGGFAEGAATGALNLARVLQDGELVDVPAEQPVAAAGATGAVGSAGAVTGASAGAPSRININTADAAALQQLDGVGEATARKIVADREANGPFRTIEDLKRVSGIGDKKFANLKDAICV